MAKVLFAQEIYFPFQSTTKLSAYLKQRGHQVDLAIGDDRKIVKRIKESKPDLIAFSVLTPYRNHMLSATNATRKAGIKIPIIAGGYDITFLPQILEYSDLDIICRGEGEDALAELCDRIDANKDYTNISNLWVKKENEIYKNKMRPWTMDFDQLPFDDRDLYPDYDNYFKIIPFTQVLAGRGCPYSCSYCFNHGYKKIYELEGSRGYCKLRSVDNLMEELLVLKNKYKAKYIFFNDSTLTYNRKWLFECLERYKKEIKTPFSLNAVITEINDEVGEALHHNGYCKLIRFGLETGNEEFRKKVLNKNISNKQLVEGTNILKKYNLRYSIAMMLGLPGETLDFTWQTLEMAKKISAKNSVFGINIFKPFPGLDITEYGIKIGQYKTEDVSAKDLPKAIKNISSQDKNKRDYKNIAMGTSDITYYENYRVDKGGELIVRLSRFSHLVTRYPAIKPLVKVLIKLPDNFIYRLLYQITARLFMVRVHANVPWSFIIKYLLFHRGKRTE